MKFSQRDTSTLERMLETGGSDSEHDCSWKEWQEEREQRRQTNEDHGKSVVKMTDMQRPRSLPRAQSRNRRRDDEAIRKRFEEGCESSAASSSKAPVVKDPGRDRKAEESRASAASSRESRAVAGSQPQTSIFLTKE